MTEFEHMMTCAAWMTRPVPDCKVSLRWRSPTKEPDTGLLKLNGWRLAAGRWVCPANHRPDLTPAADPSWIPEDPT